jgi:hypothetical protein
MLNPEVTDIIYKLYSIASKLHGLYLLGICHIRCFFVVCFGACMCNNSCMMI